MKTRNATRQLTRLLAATCAALYFANAVVGVVSDVIRTSNAYEGVVR